ncbi:MAG TPA: STAS domain-containing protein [Gaiellaceae bacterium]|jgi:anti-sigma B factor antagonist
MESRFSIESTRVAPDRLLVVVRGEVDLHVAPQLAAELERHGSELGLGITVDLTDVPFCDSSGIGVLLAASKRLGRSRLSVIAPGPDVRRSLELTGADRALNLVDGTGD